MRKKYTITLSLLTMLIALPQLGFAQLSDGPVTNDECVRFSTPMMRYRSTDAQTGGEVSMLQDFLITKGYLSGAPTGFFGAMTVRAVKDYQGKKGVDMTGNVGALTKSKISGDTCSGTSVTATTPVISGGPVATPASISPTTPVDVSSLQRQIADLMDQLNRARRGGDDSNFLKPVITALTGGISQTNAGKYYFTIEGTRLNNVGTVVLKYSSVVMNIPFVDLQSISNSKIAFEIAMPAAQYEDTAATLQVVTRDGKASNIMPMNGVFHNPNHVTEAPLITVDTPMAGDQKSVGSSINIHWTWNNGVSIVAEREGFALALAEVDANGSIIRLTPIANDLYRGTVKNGANYVWTIPSTVRTGNVNGYQIQVSTEDCCKPTAVARSARFMISDPVSNDPAVLSSANAYGKDLPDNLNLVAADIASTDVTRMNMHMLRDIYFLKGKYKALRAQFACRRPVVSETNSTMTDTYWVSADLQLGGSTIGSYTCNANQESTFDKVLITNPSGTLTMPVTDSESWKGVSVGNRYAPYGILQFTGIGYDGVEYSLKAFAFTFSIKG